MSVIYFLNELKIFAKNKSRTISLKIGNIDQKWNRKKSSAYRNLGRKFRFHDFKLRMKGKNIYIEYIIVTHEW